MEDIKLLALDLSVLSDELIEVLLLDSYAEPSLFEEIAQKNTHRPEVLRLVLNHPRTPENVRQFAAQKLQVPVPHAAPSAVSAEQLPEDENVREQRTQSLLQRIQKMRVGERIQLALRGSRDIRSILIRDPNKGVMLTVLENHRITDSEIEIIAKQKTSHEEALRAIANKREWLKNYSIVLALVTNPKTPIPIAMKHVLSIRTKDLALIEKNKNVSEGVRSVAKRLIAARRIS
jgi:TusA-related sulfurtransferase